MRTVKQELKSQGRNWNWLSNQLGITDQTLRNWRRNGAPKIYQEKICEILGVDGLDLNDLEKVKVIKI